MVRRLTFKGSRQNDCFVAFKYADIDGEIGYYAHIANKDIQVIVGVPYDCDVVPMHSKRGFIVKRAVRALDSYTKYRLGFTVTVEVTDELGGVKRVIFDPTINCDHSHSVRELREIQKLNKNVPVRPVNFNDFVAKFSMDCFNCYKEYSKKIIKNAK